MIKISKQEKSEYRAIILETFDSSESHKEQNRQDYT